MHHFSHHEMTYEWLYEERVEMSRAGDRERLSLTFVAGLRGANPGLSILQS